MVQIRNMPDAIHRKLKARAAEEGLTLSDYLLRELRVSAARPTRAQLLERLRSRAPFEPKTPPGVVVRQERDRT